MIDFTSRQLRAFLLVAQHRSFTRAAGALFITPSGLSLLIKEMENQLSVRLFERTTRQVTLTRSGSELLVAVQRNLDELDNSLAHVARTKDALGPSLSVGAPPFWAAGGVAQAIKAFRPRRPELRLQVFDGDSATTLQKVESGELDMGLGFFFKNVPGIRRTSLFRFSLMAIRANSERDSSPRNVTWASLKGEKFVAMQPSLPLQQFVEQASCESWDRLPTQSCVELSPHTNCDGGGRTGNCDRSFLHIAGVPESRVNDQSIAQTYGAP